jgi:cell wall-associated NlpC family hydrolase
MPSRPRQIAHVAPALSDLSARSQERHGARRLSAGLCRHAFERPAYRQSARRVLHRAENGVSSDFRSSETPQSPGAGLRCRAAEWARRSTRNASLAVLALGVAGLILVASPSPAAASEPNAVTTPTATVQAVVADLGTYVVSIAKRYLGYRYTWGGTSPSTGFDCSGFTYYVYKAAGHPIPRSLYSQRWSGSWVSRYSLRPGDLVFFKNTYRTGLSHVGIYTGGGYFINAQSERVGVKMASLNSYYWSSHYYTARRIR